MGPWANFDVALSRDSTFGLPFRHKPVSPSVSKHAPVLIWITLARMSSEITATHKEELRWQKFLKFRNLHF